MSAPSKQAKFDELMHGSVRLRICAGLAPLRWAEFDHLRDSLEITHVVLSKQLQELAEAGYVTIQRFTKRGRDHVRMFLSKYGRKAYVGHIAALRAVTEDDATRNA